MSTILQRVIAGFLGVVALPVVLVLAVLVRARLGRPVFHRQRRAGLHGEPFLLMKLRTMTEERDPATGRLLPDGERLKSFGRWLRATSLDELPELWHVVRGEMALVGPRPLPVQYLDRYTERERHRHDVRPGLTGWAQVRGRNAVDWDERLELDVWYVEHRSWLLDLKILALTPWVVLRKRGVSAEGLDTMSELRPPA